jgi:hypothetical protein
MMTDSGNVKPEDMKNALGKTNYREYQWETGGNRKIVPEQSDSGSPGLTFNAYFYMCHRLFQNYATGPGYHDHWRVFPFAPGAGCRSGEGNFVNDRRDVSSAAGIMRAFSNITGLDPVTSHKKRYLWTDSFAVCNYLGLYSVTRDRTYLSLGLRLVDQVHHTLGRHRDDDSRKGWISGLSDKEGESHPTIGGLRIGKTLNERKSDEPFVERLEWDRDGQYFHYLTKWMHALNRVSLATRDPVYTKWAIELARTAQARFSYAPSPGRDKRLYWKMSIDLSYPQVRSMGQHDPLDGFVTYSSLRDTATREFGLGLHPGLEGEIADIRAICRGGNLVTNDPLGIGGLLSDATRIADLHIAHGPGLSSLLGRVLSAALQGVGFFSGSGTLHQPATMRLAFRELGLSAGLRGVGYLKKRIDEHPDEFNEDHRNLVRSLHRFFPLADAIEQFWMRGENQASELWTGHREINMTMLATSLVPEGFLGIGGNLGENI